MKIAIDIRTAGGEKTGKGFYTFHLVHELLKLDQENEYLLYTDLGVPGFEQFKNAKQKFISSKGIFWHLAVARDCKNQGIDLYWAPTSYITPTFLSNEIKVMITVHDLVAFLFPENHNKKAVFLEKLFLKRALKKCDRVLAVSISTKKDLLEKFDYDEAKIETVYCAASENFQKIPGDELGEFAKESNLPEKFFLAVGTIEPRKNYIRLLRAFAKFSEKRPDIHLIIVGGKGWQYEEVELEIRKNYLTKKVHMLGYLSGTSLVKLYNLASALVFPTLYEGFGIPPLEAMQSGCPVIASNRASLPEVVGDAALMIDPENEDQLAQAMLKIINPEIASKLSAAGLEQAKKFSWKRSAEKVLLLCNS